jgi:hypothetical protein
MVNSRQFALNEGTFMRALPGTVPGREQPDRFQLHLCGHRTGKVLGSEVAAYTAISMMLPTSGESDGVPADEFRDTAFCPLSIFKP